MLARRAALRRRSLCVQAYQLGPEEPPQYALEGSIAIAGAGVSWLRDRMGLIGSAADSEAVASSVADTGGWPAGPLLG